MPLLCHRLTNAIVREVIECADNLNGKFNQGEGPGTFFDDYAVLDEMPAPSAASSALQRVLESLDWEQRIEIKAIVYVGRGDCVSFREAMLIATEDFDQASDVPHLMEMAPLAQYLRAGVAKLGIDLTQEGLVGTDVESAAKLALMEIAFLASQRRAIQQAAEEIRFRLLKQKSAAMILKMLRKQRPSGKDGADIDH